MLAELMPICALPMDDAKLFAEWMKEQRFFTHFDPKVISYPRSAIVRVKNEDETTVMVPVHPVLMIESLGKKPGMGKPEAFQSLKEISDLLEEACLHTGFGEQYFLTGDESFVRAAILNGNWRVALYDQERKTWLMKRRTNVDWQALGEKALPES